jgi:hypothetical protein
VSAPPDPWPCSKCGARGVRNLGTTGHCSRHLVELLATFGRGAGATGPGIGAQVGVDRPEHGAHMADLECLACGATWVGRPGDRCAWCERADANLARWQAELLLHPELPDPADCRRVAALGAWADRLQVAVAAGLITDHQGAQALRRERERTR